MQTYALRPPLNIVGRRGASLEPERTDDYGPVGKTSRKVGELWQKFDFARFLRYSPRHRAGFRSGYSVASVVLLERNLDPARPLAEHLAERLEKAS